MIQWQSVAIRGMGVVCCRCGTCRAHRVAWPISVFHGGLSKDSSVASNSAQLSVGKEVQAALGIPLVTALACLSCVDFVGRGRT